MTPAKLVNMWFEKWETGDYKHLPVSEDFKHTSPFGTIEGKKAYFNLIESNKEKFLNHTFEIHDKLFNENRACVRYTARQGKNHTLEVSEWFVIKNDKIQEILAYYHIGDILQGRKLEETD